MIYAWYKEWVPVEKMRQERDVTTIKDGIKLGRLRWFGHVKRSVKRREEGNWVRYV